MFSDKGYSALRRGRVYEVGLYYHLVFSTQNREPFFTQFNAARVAVNALRFCDEHKWSKTSAFVIMPDHIHWLVQAIGKTPDQLVSSVKRHIMKNTEPCVAWNTGYYDRGLRAEEELIDVARYIIANPKRAGIVSHVADYPHWDCEYL